MREEARPRGIAGGREKKSRVRKPALLKEVRSLGKVGSALKRKRRLKEAESRISSKNAL